MGNTEIRNASGELHNENGPALVRRGRGFLGLRTQEEKWCLNGQLHRENGPAHTEYEEGFVKFSKGSEVFTIDFGMATKKYYKHGKLHAEYKPAVIIELDWMNEEKLTFKGEEYIRKRTFNKSKPLIIKQYYENGQLHNMNGPAMDGYNNFSDFYNKVSHIKRYFIHGKEYTRAEYSEITAFRQREILSILQSEEIKEHHPQKIKTEYKQATTNNKKEETKNTNEMKNHCSICMKEPKQILFVPCGHVDACVECSEQVQNCHICRRPIKGRIRAFIT